MDNLLTILFSFPTVLLTIPLALVVLYWLLVILGALEIELFSFDVGVENAGSQDFFLSLGLGGVPLTVTLSLLILWSWLLTALGVQFLNAMSTSDLPWVFLLELLLLTLSLLVATGLSVLSVQPLRRFFDSPEGRRRHSLVGKICTVTTLRVDEGFGQAEFDDGGAGLLIQVRARAGEGLAKGSPALIVACDDQAEAYQVESLDKSRGVSLRKH